MSFLGRSSLCFLFAETDICPLSIHTVPVFLYLTIYKIVYFLLPFLPTFDPIFIRKYELDKRNGILSEIIAQKDLEFYSNIIR